MLKDWALAKLEAVKNSPRVFVRDSLGLLPGAHGAIHRFARDHGFTVIIAATNLVFRELYEQAVASPEVRKILVIDRAPARRRAHASITKAPPPFYPDLLVEIPKKARIDLDLGQFLKETTGDPNWPQDVNEPRYARLIAGNLEAVLRAHKNLRTAQPGRFTDHDFKTIVAFSALGVPEAAFKRLGAEDYWKIGLLGHEALADLEFLTPEVTRPIRDELRKAPSPFCWFADHGADLVIRAFYLSVILSQHVEHWNLLLANIDPDLARFGDIKLEILSEAAPKLVALDREQAHRDLEAVERSLSRETLQLLLLDQMKITEPANFAAVILNERYSVLIRCLALLPALDDLVSKHTSLSGHSIISSSLFPETGGGGFDFVDTRPSVAWSHLKEAYSLAGQIRPLQEVLARTIKNLRVTRADRLSFKLFRDIWNEKRINRLEYLLSAFERLVTSGDFLPRLENELPSVFGNTLDRIRKSARTITEEVQKHLDEVNRRFQELVALRYSSWVANDREVRLTSQFLRRCLKPHWDSKTENAVVFIFDGMRYDIWDELLRPMLEDRMEILEDYPASSLLPSETYVTRKAISAGTYPDEFDTRAAEDKLLKAGLAREFSYSGEVEVVTPEGLGTGETVHYRAGNLDVYIFELCDKELHKIQVKTLPDGRQVPARPLAFIYQQHLKNIIDTEVMAIVRGLAPGTKVFVTADHGFGRVHRERIWLEASWLNQPGDCSYLNAWLRQSLVDTGAPGKARQNVWEFPVADLRMPDTETVYDRREKQNRYKQYATIIFPKTGYALSRPNAHFNPDAFTHGGISIDELMIPMVAMRVKPMEESLLSLDAISGPIEVVEGEEIEFRMRINRTGLRTGTSEELRVDIEATYSREPDKRPLAPQVLYISSRGTDMVYRFQPDPNDATDEERRQGTMERTLTISASYREGRHTSRKSRTCRFRVRLNPERIVRRVPAHLGNILGLTPKSMR